MVELEETTPPPSRAAEFPEILQSTRLTLWEFQQKRPPPSDPVFASMAHSFIVKEELQQITPLAEFPQMEHWIRVGEEPPIQ
jgi:hypothetical protein